MQHRGFGRGLKVGYGEVATALTAAPEGARPHAQTPQAALQRENDVLRELIAIHDHLTGLALQNEELASITRVLSQRTGRMVAVLDPTLEPLVVGTPTGDHVGDLAWVGEDARLHQAAQAAAEGRRALRVPPGGDAASPGFLIAPIAAGDDLLAYLVTIVEGDDRLGTDHYDLVLAQHATTVYALVMTRERAAAEMSDRVRDELVDGLLLGALSSAEEARRWARQLGYDLGRSYRVLAFTPVQAGTFLVDAGEDDAAAVARRRHVLGVLGDVVSRRAAGAVVSTRRDEVVVLLPEWRGPKTQGVRTAPQLAETVRAQFASLFPRCLLFVGIGGPCPDPGQIAKSYAQARRAAAMSQKLKRLGPVVTFEDLGIYRLLLQVPDTEELKAFADDVLGRVVSYENKHDSGLVSTLSAYLRHNGSHQRAARELHVHVNTVGYRLHKIEGLTGLHLESYEDRLAAQVAVKILEEIHGIS
jgi:sugar diacid utilization regulator